MFIANLKNFPFEQSQMVGKTEGLSFYTHSFQQIAVRRNQSFLARKHVVIRIKDDKDESKKAKVTKKMHHKKRT